MPDPLVAVGPAEYLDLLQGATRINGLLPRGTVAEIAVDYGTSPQQPLRCDVFYRQAQPEKPRPAVVFIHGGGWQGGHREQFWRQAIYLAHAHDFVALSIGYRLSDKAPFPAALQDAKCAMRYIRSRSEQLKIDPERVAVGGGSAGGHLALMVGLTAGEEAYEGAGGHDDWSSHANAVVAFNAVCDLTSAGEGRMQPDGPRAKFMGAPFEEKPERYREASPFFRANPKAPPVLMLHGEDDKTVAVEQARKLKVRLDEFGVPCELATYPEKGHGWFNAAPDFWPTLQRAEKFLLERLKR